MTGRNMRKIGLRICHRREALGYGRERLIELSEISDSFLLNIERGDWGFSVALFGRFSRVLGFSTDYTLFGAEQTTDTSDVTDIPSGLNGKCIPKLKELLDVYLKTTTLTEKQNH